MIQPPMMRAVIGLGVGSTLTLGVSTVLSILQTPDIPIALIPSINLAGIIAGSVSMGMLFQRVKALEEWRHNLERKE